MPQYAVERLYALTKDRDTYITTEVGQHQMWAAQFYRFEEPNRWMTSGGLGTMGYGLPAAIGVQMAHPKSLVIDIAGDASILMNLQEMSTAIQYRLQVKVFILNNQYMGMVRQWQTLFYNERYSNTDLGTHKHRVPDFVKLAEALGCIGLRCESKDDVDKIIQQAMEINDVPVVIDFTVGKDAMVWPMVAAGTSNDEIMFARDVRPAFEEDDL